MISDPTQVEPPVSPAPAIAVVTVLVVDDHPLVRAGLAGLIDATADLRVVGAAAGGEEAVGRAVELQPDVVLMDLSMPGIDGVEATRRVLASCPTVRVLVLTSFHDHDRVSQALEAGAIGYLLKNSDPVELLSGIRSAARGHSPLDPRVASALLPTAKTRLSDSLSGRERQVLALITRGMSNRQIGRELGITERTVKVHIGHLFRRLGVADRTSAAVWAKDNLPR
ncbi:DNA-binding NarL/FixJ family response regulator [Nakamurella sp. UYEF19]|uniref:response regulator transcription factor n=1 Tax=Nakamurella sp. UYEF19 TaxID=1756392 RepID=UPI0033976DD9